jgi:hypothetical protein
MRQKAKEDLLKSQSHAAAWISTKNNDFKDFSHLRRKEVEARLPPELRSV